VITVPPPDGPRELLWERFASVFGLTDLDLDLAAERANPSLGVPETALLRRLNARANDVVPPDLYRPLVRELLAHQTLSQRRSSPRLTLPPEPAAWAQELTRTWVAELRERRYHVVGDLEELLGSAPATWTDPDQADEQQVADAAVDALRALLVENGRLLRSEQDLARRLAETEEALRRSHLRPSYRFREKAVRALQRSRPGRWSLELYRRARGRSSRSA
jgi:hypothetical protein